MKKSLLQADVLLLITAIIWGFAFVAQRAGMEFIGPFTFNAIRFALGGLVLFPVLLIQKKKTEKVKTIKPFKFWWLLIGIALFAGASLQQIGLVYTTAGNAGFITGMYVVFVPLLSLIWGQRTSPLIWIAALITFAGLYFLSVKDDLSFSSGDLIELAGALFWAAHVHLVSVFSKKINPVKVAQRQFFVCSFLSFIAALIFENFIWNSIVDCLIPLLYGGLLSVGIAYTLQVVAQKKAHPAHASIILSAEALFAAIGGWLILHEALSFRAIFGAGLMLAGMILAQLGNLKFCNFEKK